MRINIANIPVEGLQLDFMKKPEWLSALIPDAGGLDAAVGDMAVHCFLRKDMQTVIIEGEVETRLSVECCRCLEKFDFPVRGSFRYELVPAETLREEEETELTPDDFDAGVYRDEVIDLDPIVAEQIILQIPVKPLCRESCRGLCLVCGGNLNVHECTHEQEQVPGPFTVLKGFKVNKKGG